VLAAAFPVSELSGQVGTLVKLVRVLMLGPVVLFFALYHRLSGRSAGTTTASTHAKRSFSITHFVPWFILGFLLLAALRSSGVIPPEIAARAWKLSGWLTIAAMAALGLGVDLRALKAVGRSVALTVTGSLLVLIVLAIGLIHALKIQ